MSALKPSTSSLLRSQITATILLTALLLALFVLSSRAASEAPQTQWEKTYGTVEGYSVVHTDDGGYALVCHEGF